MTLISPNWPLRLVCCAALLLWMPERSAGDVGPEREGEMVSLLADATPCSGFGGDAK